MKTISNSHFTGERACFISKNIRFSNCTFADGESPLKQSRDIFLANCGFEWKYPLWYCEHFRVDNSTLLETARSGVWYSKNGIFRHCLIEAPKTFRRAQNITLEHCFLPNASETFWNCQDICLKNVQAKGDYFIKDSENIEVSNLQISGNYAFDGCKNIKIKDSVLLSKDAFWNCENVVAQNCTIIGEYLGWNSSNVTFINCHIQSLQGLCFMRNLEMKSCTLLNSDLVFEYSSVNAQIMGKINSVKNPNSGRIEAEKIDEIIIEADKIDPSKIEIKTAQ